MGMATYYLKARFASPRSAQAALPKLTALIDEGAEAERLWNARPEQPGKPFWSDFKKRYPLVFDFLGKPTRADSHAVSYALNFGDDHPTPTIEGKFLFFSAYVWHFADWALLAKFVKAKLGAMGVDWISEECVDPFELLHP